MVFEFRVLEFGDFIFEMKLCKVTLELIHKPLQSNPKKRWVGRFTHLICAIFTQRFSSNFRCNFSLLFHCFTNFHNLIRSGSADFCFFAAFIGEGRKREGCLVLLLLFVVVWGCFGEMVEAGDWR